MARNRRHKSRRRGLAGNVGRGISKVGSTGKNVADKGVSGVFNFLSKGFNMGTKDVKSGVGMFTKRRRSRRSRRSRKSRKH
jgi:hypothetical protein